MSSWEDVRARVKPQLCPAEHLSRAPVAHRLLGHQLLASVVVDDDASYRYVTESDLADWKIDFEDLLRYATLNLNDACNLSGAPLQISPAPDLLMSAVTRDGFDAARILIPEFRTFIGSLLGSPFRWAAPHRDCLLCWSVNNGESFRKLTLQRLFDDWRDAPFPLSASVFEADSQRIWPCE